MYPVWSLPLKHENLNEISNVHVEAIQNGTTLNAKYWGGEKRKGSNPFSVKTLSSG